VVHGKLRCLGTAQHLKHRFGNGYQLDVKLKTVSSFDLIGYSRHLATERLLSDNSAVLLSLSIPVAAVTQVNGIRPDGVDPDRHRVKSSRSDDNADGQHEQSGDEIPNEISSFVHVINNVRVLGPLQRVISALRHYDSSSASGTGNTSVREQNLSGESSLEAAVIEDMSLPSVLEWWIYQRRERALTGFLKRLCPHAVLVERASSHHFRYQIPMIDITGHTDVSSMVREDKKSEVPLRRGDERKSVNDGSPGSLADTKFAPREPVVHNTLGELGIGREEHSTPEDYPNENEIEPRKVEYERKESDKEGTSLSSVTLARLFTDIEACKDMLALQDYSLGLSSLEQIFNHFAASK